MERLRILTLNIWNRQGPWELRRELILQGLHIEEPDVVALQEVLRLRPAPSQAPGAAVLCQLDELAAPLGLIGAYTPATRLGGVPPGAAPGADDDSPVLELGNAVLSRHPIYEQRGFVLPNPMRHESRSLLYALIETPAGPLPFFCTHLDWQLELSWVRCQQVRFITDRIDEIVAGLRAAGREPLPAVLAGDFNAEPESDEIRYLCGLHVLPGLDVAHPAPDTAPHGQPRSVYYADCFARCTPAADIAATGATFARSNRYAAREREPDRRLDYIFVGNLDAHLRGEPLLCRRCFTASQYGGDGPEGNQDGGPIFASDHYGVVAEIQVGRRKKAAY